MHFFVLSLIVAFVMGSIGAFLFSLMDRRPTQDPRSAADTTFNN